MLKIGLFVKLFMKLKLSIYYYFFRMSSNFGSSSTFDTSSSSDFSPDYEYLTEIQELEIKELKEKIKVLEKKSLNIENNFNFLLINFVVLFFLVLMNIVFMCIVFFIF